MGKTHRTDGRGSEAARAICEPTTSLMYTAERVTNTIRQADGFLSRHHKMSAYAAYQTARNECKKTLSEHDLSPEDVLWLNNKIDYCELMMSRNG